MDLADIVHLGLNSDALDKFLRYLQLFRQSCGILPHPHNMVAGIFIIGFRSPGQGPQRIDKGILHRDNLVGDGFKEEPLHDQVLNHGHIMLVNPTSIIAGE